MTLEVTFFGGADDYEHGELGGVQVLFHDTEKKSNFLLDCGQRPDHTSDYYGFPYMPKSFQSLAISEFLELYPRLEGIYRHDYERRRGNTPKDPPIDGLLITHGHYDHVGGLTLVRHDLPTYMNTLTKQILWLWQYTGSKMTNQFIDMYDQFSLGAGVRGIKFFSGDEALLPRDIRPYEPEKTFSIGKIPITAYAVDHSLPGSCGFILDTSIGKFGISGDIRCRGKNPHYTEHFLKNLEHKDLSYFMCEGSLLHFNHSGSESDIPNAITDLIKGKAFVGMAYPPRDYDRITSMYKSAEQNGRMLVVSPSQAVALQLLDGAEHCPRINWKYIGVLLPKKNKGLLDSNFSPEIIERDYDLWERAFLRKEVWNEHKSKIQRVRLEDIKNNQDKFIVYLPYNYMIEMLQEIAPAKNSIYIRSHPGPWTPEMQIQETRQINVLKSFDMYDGPQPDYFTRSIQRNMHQVHVTGHFNREEVRAFLHRIITTNPRVTIIPYHCMRPKDFVEDVAQSAKNILVPIRGEKQVLS